MSKYLLRLNEGAQAMGRSFLEVHAIIALDVGEGRYIYLISLPKDLSSMKDSFRGYALHPSALNSNRVKELRHLYTFHTVSCAGFEVTYAADKVYREHGSEITGRRDLIWINPRKNAYVDLIEPDALNNEIYVQLLEEG
jgi:hypothetical protein